MNPKFLVKEKMLVQLNVAYELISSVHSTLCRETTRKTDISRDSCDLAIAALKLSERIEKEFLNE